MNKCPTCGANCEKEYCFKHKPRKPIPGKSLKVYSGKRFVDTLDDLTDDIAKQTALFISIWNKRPHKSEVSGEYLGKEILTVYFHHILPKNKYPQAEYDEDNIILLTFAEHESVEADMYKYEEVNRRREQLKIKYNL